MIWLQKWSILKQNVIWCHLIRAVHSLNCEGRACLWLTGPEVIKCPIAALWASMTCDLLLASWPEFPPFVGGRWANPPEHISPFWATFRPDPAQLMNYLTRLHINETLAIKSCDKVKYPLLHFLHVTQHQAGACLISHIWWFMMININLFSTRTQPSEESLLYIPGVLVAQHITH